MKEILAPIDFSQNSLNSLRYAAALANDTNATLRIIHAYTVAKRAGRLKSIEPRLVEDATRDLNDFISIIREDFPDLKIESKIIKGETLKVIDRTFKQFDSDLVVVASVGEHEVKNIFMSSVTGGLIKLSDLPVLVIPKNAFYTPFKEILFAVKNTSVYDVSVVEALQKVRGDLGATVHLCKAIAPEASDLDEKECQLKDKFDDYEEIEGKGVFEVVQDYLNSRDIQMLTVIRRKRGFFERALSNTVTPDFIFEFHIPMLVLHGEL